MTKPTKWNVRPAKTQISLGIHAGWSVFAVHMKEAWVLSYPLSAQQRLWSDWADQSLRWAHSHFVGFVMRRLIFLHRNSNKIQVSKLFGMKLLITDEMEWITTVIYFVQKSLLCIHTFQQSYPTLNFKDPLKMQEHFPLVRPITWQSKLDIWKLTEPQHEKTFLQTCMTW